MKISVSFLPLSHLAYGVPQDTGIRCQHLTGVAGCSTTSLFLSCSCISNHFFLCLNAIRGYFMSLSLSTNEFSIYLHFSYLKYVYCLFLDITAANCLCDMYVSWPRICRLILCDLPQNKQQYKFLYWISHWMCIIDKQHLIGGNLQCEKAIVRAWQLWAYHLRGSVGIVSW